MSLQHFQFSGTAYEQGLAHGETLKESIENNISVYLSRFETEAGITNKKLNIVNKFTIEVYHACISFCCSNCER